MIYKVKIDQHVVKVLKKVADPEKTNIKNKINDLAVNPRQGSMLKGQWRGLWRVRVGQYRIIYAIHDDRLVILVLKLGHRKDVYR